MFGIMVIVLWSLFVICYLIFVISDYIEFKYQHKETGMEDKLIIGGIEFKSRLWVGTGKYKDFEETAKAIEASGADVVTVAVRRTNIFDSKSENLLDFIDPKKYKILPNTAGCYTLEDALRYARLARETGVSDLIKIEVIGDENTLFPDACATLKATEILAKEGFIVLPYINDDPVMALRLVDAGAAAVMPLAAPIGSGLGIRNPYNLKIILEQAKVPIVVDAGVGTASDVAKAMELGSDAVLLNTAIAGADDPIAMAEAMKYGAMAGRLAYKAGRIPRKLYATASSPIEGML
jgi:thiazole synthase